MRVRQGWQVLQRKASRDQLGRLLFPLRPRSLKLRELLVACTLLAQDRQTEREPCVCIFSCLFCVLVCLLDGLFVYLVTYSFVCFLVLLVACLCVGW